MEIQTTDGPKSVRVLRRIGPFVVHRDLIFDKTEPTYTVTHAASGVAVRRGMAYVDGAAFLARRLRKHAGDIFEADTAAGVRERSAGNR